MHQTCADVNLISRFLALQQIQDLWRVGSVDCIVICISQVFAQSEKLFRRLEENPSMTKTLVIVGGIGHSTQAIYDAVASHPKYHPLAASVVGLPESLVMGQILSHFFDKERIMSQGCKIFFEDKSTTCGSNAINTRQILLEGKVPTPRSCVVIQDPTMLRRTVASFQKAYEEDNTKPEFIGCPLFVPLMEARNGSLEYRTPDGFEGISLWPKQRFWNLLVGEIPRLRDDQDGYGPKGKGFICHVDVPEEVQLAAQRVEGFLGVARPMRT